MPLIEFSLYEEYLDSYGTKSADFSVSFTVEELGWIQINVFEYKTILYKEKDGEIKC